MLNSEVTWPKFTKFTNDVIPDYHRWTF